MGSAPLRSVSGVPLPSDQSEARADRHHQSLSGISAVGSKARPICCNCSIPECVKRVALQWSDGRCTEIAVFRRPSYPLFRSISFVVRCRPTSRRPAVSSALPTQHRLSLHQAQSDARRTRRSFRPGSRTGRCSCPAIAGADRAS